MSEKIRKSRKISRGKRKVKFSKGSKGLFNSNFLHDLSLQVLRISNKESLRLEFITKFLLCKYALNKKGANKKRKLIGKFINKRPILSISILLGFVLLMIVAGDQLRRPPERIEVRADIVKKVEVYRIGEAPQVRFNARIEKSGVITIVSQASGVVSNIFAFEGQEVGRGAPIIGLSSNYQGGNALSIQRQISQLSYNFQKDNFDFQKNAIANDRELAEKADTNSDELRRITDDSLSRTNEIISNSYSTISLIDDLLAFYESVSTPTLSDAATDENVISGLKQQKVGLLSGLSAAEQALRSAKFSSGGDNAPARISDLTRESTLSQLALQEKTLELNLEISRLNFRLSQATEALMFPAAPFSGRVERVHVRVGQVVNPGDPLITFTGTKNNITAVALVNKEVAQQISKIESSKLRLGNVTFETLPSYISSEPTNNRLVAVLFSIPTQAEIALLNLKGEFQNDLADAVSRLVEGQYISIDIPIGYANTSKAFPFVPIDAIFQSQDQSILFVNNNGLAQNRTVVLGQIFGRFVEVIEGLNGADEVILNRNVIEGDKIEVK